MNLMKNSTRTALFGLVAALGLSLAGVASAADTGTVKGKVMGKDSKPVAGANVVLVKAEDAKGGGKKKEAPAAAAGDKKGEKPTPVSKGKTESDGSFTLKDVPAGEYQVRAMAKGQGSAHEKVTVKAGETADVTLNLKEGKGGGKKKEAK